jgi:hypothetical protein
MKHLVASLFVALLLAGPAAHAQDGNVVSNDTFNVTSPVPEGWTVNEENERATFNFEHEASSSQIEVIGTELVTADVADVFFNTFHDTLTSAEFLQRGREDKQVGAYSGTETIYSFTHSGVTLKVVVFQFVRDTTAWLAVGYMQEDVFDEHAESYRAVLAGLTFAE